MTEARARNRAGSRMRRKRFGALLTHRLERDLSPPGAVEAGDPGIRRVVVMRSDRRLGNQLLTTPLVEEIARVFPAARIDVLARGRPVEFVYSAVPAVARALSLPSRPLVQPGPTARVWRRFRETDYDLAFNAASDSNTTRVLMRLCRARYKLASLPQARLLESYPEAIHKAFQKVISLRIQVSGLDRDPAAAVPALSMPLTEAERTAGKGALRALTSETRPVLGLYTFATGSRRFDAEWWHRLHAVLAERLPAFDVVEALPVENVSAFDFRLPAYYSRSIRELGAFLSHCDLFVTGDCGVMHLASAVGAPTIGLFRTTPRAMYAPYNPGSLGIDAADRTPEEVAAMVIDHALRRGLVAEVRS
jgi:ADP-heptose:LPS heptosyltransferase